MSTNNVLYPYSVSRLTGCTSGRVPDISIEEALESSAMIKAVDRIKAWSLYAEVTSIDYSNKTFEMVQKDGSPILNLPLDQFLFFKAEPIAAGIPTTVDSAIICDNEIFTVVTDDTIPIWVGQYNRVYYAEDIQALTQEYGYETLWD